MFEVTGARSTTAALRLDRFWRNVRVHTLHDQIDYKVRELGDWALNGRVPKASFYSRGTHETVTYTGYDLDLN
jgi:alkylation response protein AidB-like acyl-CoA dehydrogenase